jgi:streptogramin lyase
VAYGSGNTAEQIDRLFVDGGVQTDVLSSDNEYGAGDLAIGGDGHIWFNDVPMNAIGRLEADGGVQEFTVADSEFPGYSGPTAVLSGPNGVLWFSYFDVVNDCMVGRIETDGGFLPAYCDATANDAGQYPEPVALTWGSDGALWFADGETCLIGRLGP